MPAKAVIRRSIMINSKGKTDSLKGVIICFLVSAAIAAGAYYAGLKIEPGKILPTGLSMRSGMMSDSIVHGINLAIDDINLIRSGNAGTDLWRLLTFVHLDLFFYLALLLPGTAAKAVLMAGYFVRFGLCAAAMYYFMSEHLKLKRMLSGILAAMYAFSTQVVFTAQLAGIMNMSVMLPVVMSAVDSYYKKRTWKSFSILCIASFCLGATGGYGIMTGIPAIVFISFLMSFGLYNTAKMALSSWVKALGSIFTGLVLTAVISVPGLYIMTSEVNIPDSFKNAKVLYTVYDLVRGMFVLRSGSIVMNSAPVFYIGTLTVVAIIAFALNETIPLRLKVASGVITIVFYSTCCSSFVNETISVFGTSPILTSTRLIGLEALLFFIAGIGLKNIKGLSKGAHIATCLIPLGFLVAANNSTAGTTLASPILIATFIAIIFESYLVYGLAQNRISGRAKIVFFVVICAFVGINASFIMFNIYPRAQNSPGTPSGSSTPVSGSTILVSTPKMEGPTVLTLCSMVSVVLLIVVAGDASVWPYVITISGMCIFSMTSSIVLIGQGEPAMMPVLMCEKSVLGKFSCPSIAMNIVGTPWKQVIFS